MSTSDSAGRGQALPVRARLFVTAVCVAGAAAVYFSTVTLLHSVVPVAWVLFAVLTIASGMLTLKIPSIETRFSVSEAFAFACDSSFLKKLSAVNRSSPAVHASKPRRAVRLRSAICSADIFANFSRSRLCQKSL